MYTISHNIKDAVSASTDPPRRGVAAGLLDNPLMSVVLPTNDLQVWEFIICNADAN